MTRIRTGWWLGAMAALLLVAGCASSRTARETLSPEERAKVEQDVIRQMANCVEREQKVDALLDRFIQLFGENDVGGFMDEHGSEVDWAAYDAALKQLQRELLRRLDASNDDVKSLGNFLDR